MANVVGESSSSTKSRPKYSPDVFLSFAGKDVRHGFTAHLYSALHRKGIKTFRDDKTLRKGQPFALELLAAIEESKISIIVFSEGYWTSKWCLNELVRIHKCAKKDNQRVFPIFYKVEPSDVRDKKIFEVAMKKLNKRQKGKNKPEFSVEQMEEWWSALLFAGNLEGYPLRDGFDESEFIERIVQDVSKLAPKHLSVDQHIVGLKTRVEDVMSLLDIGSGNPTEMLLIHGTGGIGKTTLVIALFNEIVDQFEGASFLSNVSEASKQADGLASLQKKLLKEAHGEDFEFGSDIAGAYKIQQLLCNKRILLILDDINERKQIEKLAGGPHWFGFGSRIIITSRDLGLLNPNDVGTRSYKMEVLNEVDALECFSWKAFNKILPPQGFENLSDCAVRYAKGLPLALHVIGSDLNFCQDPVEWEHALCDYEKNQHQGILGVLRKSYDRLSRNEKTIFLDIVCFFKGKKKEYVEMSLVCEHAITILACKSLITIQHGILGMHNLVQQMGREIMMEESHIPGQPIRLWHHEKIVEVLTEDTGTGNTEGIILDSSNNHREKLPWRGTAFEGIKSSPETLIVNWRGTSFKKMKSLRILMVMNATFSKPPTHLPNNLSWLEWGKYPSGTLPSDFSPNKLVVLDLPRSQFSECGIKTLKGTYLSRLNLSLCSLLREIPDMSGFPKLRELILSGCENLTKVDDSLGLCSKLVHLDVSGCKMLEILPHKIKMPFLEYFDLRFCRSLQHFPNVEGEINTLQSIKLVNVEKIKKQPESIKNITSLKVLYLHNCPALEELPIFKLQSLEVVKIWNCHRLSFRKLQTKQESDSGAINCPNLQQLSVNDCNLSDDDLTTILSCFPKLRFLELSKNKFTSIPGSIEFFVDLRDLDVSYCPRLQKIPKLPSTLQKITILECFSLTSESQDMLWSQAREEVDGLQIVLDLFEWEKSIPTDLHRLENFNGFVSFKTGKRFPFTAFVFVCDYLINRHFGPFAFKRGRVVDLFINGRLVNEKGPFAFKRGRIVLVDLRNCEKNRSLDAFLVHERNHVDVRCGRSLQVFGVPCRELQMNKSSIGYSTGWERFKIDQDYFKKLNQNILKWGRGAGH